jgi:L-alanine-DL-glutamate epimerase-like enolase superfamily enzyme
MLRHIEVRRLALPLTTRYHLSFGDVHAFDTVLVRLHDEHGREGLGDATVLTGYTDETIDGAWAGAQQWADALAGADEDDALQRLATLADGAPFLATAFTTAIEMMRGSPWLKPVQAVSVPVLGTINASQPQAMRAQIDALCAQGYRTLKIKVGNDAVADAVRIGAALAQVAGRAMLRVDANQGYSPAQAIRFAHAVPVQGIELFEQPCAAGDWAAHAQVAADCPLPLMLDESIYTEADIDRAADTGAASFVKVKLMKFVSLQRLAAAIDRIRARGMEPVLGNGVATEIGCWMEACVAVQGIRNAGEMNGWTKMARPLLREPLALERGAIRLEPGWRPLLDEAALAAATLARHTASAAAPVGASRRGP